MQPQWSSSVKLKYTVGKKFESNESNVTFYNRLVNNLKVNTITNQLKYKTPRHKLNNVVDAMETAQIFTLDRLSSRHAPSTEEPATQDKKSTAFTGEKPH